MKTAPRSKSNAYRRRYSAMKQLGYEFMVPVTGTKRRLEALMCMGYSLTEVGQHLDPPMRQQNISYLVHGRKRVYRETRDKIAAVYDELHMRPNQSRTAVRTRELAKRNGYAPPLAWEPKTIDDPKAEPRGVAR